MTTQTQAKRTEGEAQINRNDPTMVNLGASERNAMVAVGHRVDDEDIANAEYIRKAWNMHEELVAGCENLVATYDSDRSTVSRHMISRLRSLLSRCQE